MQSPECNITISFEALSEMSSIIKRLTSEVNSLRDKNKALEKRIQELSPESSYAIGAGKASNSCAIGDRTDVVPPGHKIVGDSGILYVVPENFTSTPSASLVSSALPSALPSVECQFCFKVHKKGECEYERWMDVLVDSSPVKPPDVLKHIRIIQDKWVVILVPDYYPVIVGDYDSDEYAELDFEDLKGVATNKALAHFKTLDRSIYSIIYDKSEAIYNWIRQQGLDNSF